MNNMKDYKKIFETIVSNTQKYLENNNLISMVLGISGGIDSTVVAAVCHEINKRNSEIDFIGVSLPCSTNSENENNSASQTMQAFCRKQIHQNLENAYQTLKDICGGDKESTSVSLGNIKARLRMLYLYNVAGLNKGVVMDTDNLTEHYLGFFTIHGDQGDLNPIGGLWKTEVYELAKYLRDEYYKDNPAIVHALDAAINITPTDGNGVMGSGDLDQIMPGYTYADVDKILQLTVNRILTKEDVKYFLKQNPHITLEAFMKVVDRYKNSAFKRQISPYVIDI